MTETISKSDENGSSKTLSMKVIIGMSLQLGFTVATTAILFVYGGHWLDQKYNTEYFFWIGLILGLTASLYLVWKIVKPLQASIKN